MTRPIILRDKRNKKIEYTANYVHNMETNEIMFHISDTKVYMDGHEEATVCGMPMVCSTKYMYEIAEVISNG